MVYGFKAKKKKPPEDKIEFLPVGTDADMLFPSYACNTRTDVVGGQKVNNRIRKVLANVKFPMNRCANVWIKKRSTLEPYGYT